MNSVKFLQLLCHDDSTLTLSLALLCCCGCCCCCYTTDVVYGTLQTCWFPVDLLMFIINADCQLW